MGVYPRGKFGIYWYDFYFAGRRHQGSTKTTSRTVALRAEEQRKRELEVGYNDIREVRKNRVRILDEIIDEYLESYTVRYRSATFAQYALGHVSRMLGKRMVVDINDAAVVRYQDDRLREKAAPKSINEEVGFLLRILGNPAGDLLRTSLKARKKLKLVVPRQIGKAFDEDESDALERQARRSQSPHMYPAYMLARNSALRDSEIKTLRWSQISFSRQTVQVGRAKSQAGEGRIIPLNEEVHEALLVHRRWYIEKFGEAHPDWFVFPWGKPRPSDPTRHITSFKKAWGTVKKNANVQGRWHDNRHTLITELAETGAGDETIMQIAGHVDRQMLQHYSHIRVKAKREALALVAAKRKKRSETPEQSTS